MGSGKARPPVRVVVMGLELSSCCGNDALTEERLGEATPTRPWGAKGASQGRGGIGEEGPRNEDLERFVERLENGIQIGITLGDATRFNCDLLFIRQSYALYITCKVQGERRVKPIPLYTISSVLITDDELATLEQAAGVTANDQ